MEKTIERLGRHKEQASEEALFQSHKVMREHNDYLLDKVINYANKQKEDNAKGKLGAKEVLQNIETFANNLQGLTFDEII